MARNKKKNSTPARFKVGDQVRVKQGIRDTDYPDMPLGGWAGTVSEAHKGGMYTVRWSQKTLNAINPVFKKRCEKDGMELEEYLLGKDDLEPDPGGPLDIEKPKKIKTKPLNPKDQDDRIRRIFGLTSNDPLPDVDDETLLVYYRYLAKDMLFPFEVEHFEETGPFEGERHIITVVGLLDPGEYECDEMYGLICEARKEKRELQMPLGEFEVDAEKPKLQMLADYCFWFWNFQ